jgi:protocatechuate 3,4-dioxygenase alpha subunit
MSFQATASQTVGPYFGIGLQPLYCSDIAAPGVEGERVRVQGMVLDGDGAPIPDALIEVWQANAHGRYAHPEDRQDKPLTPGFVGFGRIPTDAHGRFAFTTIKPGPVPGPNGELQAPHLAICVLMRGLLKQVATRMYFSDEPANVGDPVLRLVPESRRGTLIARRLAAGSFEWNVRMQGADETVFFDF